MPIPSITTFFEEIFSRSHPPKDKDVFYKNFVAGVFEETVLTILVRLPEKKRQQLQEKITLAQHAPTQQQIVMSFVSTAYYMRILQEVTARHIETFMSTLLPTLSPSQRENVEAYIAHIGETYKSAESSFLQIRRGI